MGNGEKKEKHDLLGVHKKSRIEGGLHSPPSLQTGAGDFLKGWPETEKKKGKI